MKIASYVDPYIYCSAVTPRLGNKRANHNSQKQPEKIPVQERKKVGGKIQAHPMDTWVIDIKDYCSIMGLDENILIAWAKILVIMILSHDWI